VNAPPAARPIIVSALFGAADFARLDAERRAHFPPERNQLPAHLTLFHHLPSSLGDELDRRLAEEARAPQPPAMIVAPMKLGQGVAWRVESERLETLRARVAEAFAGLMTPQDAAPWRPHVTIQNKAEQKEAEALYRALVTGFRPRPLVIAGLAAWDYEGGPWRLRKRYAFRG
jgi:2'-5' RNA ligase